MEQLRKLRLGVERIATGAIRGAAYPSREDWERWVEITEKILHQTIPRGFLRIDEVARIMVEINKCLSRWNDSGFVVKGEEKEWESLARLRVLDPFISRITPKS